MRSLFLSILFVLTIGIFPIFAGHSDSSKPVEKCQRLNIYCFGIEKQYFDFIVDGKKTVEGRVNMPDVEGLKIGDMVTFKDEGGREIICKVITVSKYPNFTKMLVSEGITNMLPSIDPDTNSTPEMIAKADKIYRSFPGYNENVKKYGAIAFGIKYTGMVYKDTPNVQVITDD